MCTACPPERCASGGGTRGEAPLRRLPCARPAGPDSSQDSAGCGGVETRCAHE
ncbi:Hypothetical protein AA314_01415 [Archangium gephyra]|uniref:Uncharacterized protein n=1 Tax=Archangium gephyra TaxID=48 RepID=A0AAC8Q2L7_9BACT|nr:Hypothetical protein AA314_01415 [Archangium gephyra]